MKAFKKLLLMLLVGIGIGIVSLIVIGPDISGFISHISFIMGYVLIVFIIPLVLGSIITLIYSLVKKISFMGKFYKIVDIFFIIGLIICILGTINHVLK